MEHHSWLGAGVCLLALTVLVPLRQLRHLARCLHPIGNSAAACCCGSSYWRNQWSAGSVDLSGHAQWWRAFRAHVQSHSRRFSRLGFPKRVAEITFWSSEGKDRESCQNYHSHLLERKSPMPQTTDGRTGTWKYNPTLWWAVRLTTVTEYHQKQDRLTRVRLATRATLPNFLLNFVLCSGLLTLIFLASTQVALIALSGYFIWWIVMEMMRRSAHRIAALTMQVGQTVGLLPK